MEVIENKSFRLEIENHGAELIKAVMKDKNINIIWSGDKKYWGKTSPVLFPIIGGLKNDVLIIDGNEYKIPKHGFARDREFVFDSRKDDEIWFRLSSDMETMALYPYKFDFLIGYQLIDGGFSICYKVINNDSKEIYFSVGGHPAFECPIFEGESIDDYYIEFEKDETFDSLVVEGILLSGAKKQMGSGKILGLHKNIFDEDALVFENLNSSFLVLKNKSGTYSLKCDFAGFPYMAIWSKPGADFVCIEPWYGINDTPESSGLIEEKDGIRRLEKGETFDCKYTFTAEIKE